MSEVLVIESYYTYAFDENVELYWRFEWVWNLIKKVRTVVVVDPLNVIFNFTCGLFLDFFATSFFFLLTLLFFFLLEEDSIGEGSWRIAGLRSRFDRIVQIFEKSAHEVGQKIFFGGYVCVRDCVCSERVCVLFFVCGPSDAI